MTLFQSIFSQSAIATSIGLATVLAVPLKSQAITTGFNGTYDQSNFTLENNNADGSVDTSQADAGEIVLTGGDNGSFSPGTTDWTIDNVGQTSTVEFSWSFEGENTTFSPFAGDRAGYLLNGNFTELATTNGQSSTSPVVLDINQGDSLGLRVETANNTGEPGELTVSNFQSKAQSGTPIPFGISTNTGILALIGGMASIAWRRCRRRSKTPQAKGSSSLILDN